MKRKRKERKKKNKQKKKDRKEKESLGYCVFFENVSLCCGLAN